MGMTAEDYLKAMQALLPPGLAWLREDDGALTKVLRAAAKEYERIDAYADNVTEEIDPRTTFEMLSDWENALGLPECGLELGPLAERREAAAAKLIETGLITLPDLVALAADLGFTITIDTFTPFRTTSTVDQPIYGEDWAFVLQINAPLNTIREFTTRSGVDEALRTWGREGLLECMVNRNTQGHVVNVFNYA